MSRRVIGLACAMLLAGGTAQGEVRLSSQRKPGDVRVSTAAGRHVWAPSGLPGASTLNPGGALRADGAPSLCVNGGRVLAAWQPAASTQLAMAIGTTTWQPLAGLSDVSEAVAPQLGPSDHGWIVGWTSASSGEVQIAAVGQDGTTGLPASVARGAIQALAVTESTVHVVVIEPEGGIAVVLLLNPRDQPEIFRVIRIVPLSLGAVAPTFARTSKLTASANIKLPQDAPLVFRSGASTTLLDPAWQGSFSVDAAPSSPRGNVGSVALGGSLVGVVQVSNDLAIALWWRDAHTLEFVELTDGGVGSVQQVTGRGEFSPSLVREALRR